MKKEQMLPLVLKNIFFKLMMSRQWQKMENLQKRIKIRLVNNEKYFLKQTNKATHITHNIFRKNYPAIHEIKPVLMLNKPICIGFTVLELGKFENILMLSCYLLTQTVLLMK